MWTMSGLSAGLPLTAKMRAMASALKTQPPSPYTVSVGKATSSPLRIAAAAPAAYCQGRMPCPKSAPGDSVPQAAAARCVPQAAVAGDGPGCRQQAPLPGGRAVLGRVAVPGGATRFQRLASAAAHASRRCSTPMLAGEPAAAPAAAVHDRRRARRHVAVPCGRCAAVPNRLRPATCSTDRP
jgi:hypothetical protein